MPAGPKEAIGKGCAKYTGFLGTETPADQNQPGHGNELRFFVLPPLAEGRRSYSITQRDGDMLRRRESTRLKPVNETKYYLYVSAAIFGIVALVHVIRALAGWTFQIGPVDLPVLASWVGFVITGVLAAWAIRLASNQ